MRHKNHLIKFNIHSWQKLIDVGMKRNFISSIKSINQKKKKTIAKIILNKEIFSLWDQDQAKIFPLLLFSIINGSPSEYTRNKWDTYWKGRNKTVPIHRQHDFLYRKFQYTKSKHEFSEVTRYKSTQKKLITSVYISNRQRKLEF